jgi:hypothetical protein
MSKATWACFDCRKTVRLAYGDPAKVRCAFCHKPMTNIGYKIPVPKRRNIKRWKQLHARLNARSADYETYLHEYASAHARRKSVIARRILAMKARPRTPGRTRELRRLEAIYFALD